MLESILAFFGYNKVSNLQAKSQNALNMFNKTVVQLDEVNDEIELEIGIKVDVVNKLHEDIGRLNKLTSDNNKIKNKIKSFLKD